ncbi:MAG: methylated-DNA--[protein]-cysteine S-methyltransferase [Holophaga sp.]|nr:methylated-DNA--[protein]-cysteine S-methyltransferase [Holophaga sp.]
MAVPPIPFHHYLHSPLGWIGVGLADGGKIGRLEVLPESEDTLILTPRNRREPRVLDFLKSQLDGYFRRTLRTFNLPIHLAGDALEQRVWAETLLLGFGQCVSLKVLAERMHAVERTNAVAAALRASPVAILVPTHRVLGWEEAGPLPPWIRFLRTLEDIVPGESTSLTADSLPTTAHELARAAAQAPSVTLRPKGKG